MKFLKNITLEEAWSSIKIVVGHFCVFGNEAQAHIPHEKHTAIEPKSKKCIFVGYCEDVKLYRIIQPNSKNIIIRRDVKFYGNISAYEPSSEDVPPLSIYFTFEDIPSSNSEREDENPSPPSRHLPSAH